MKILGDKRDSMKTDKASAAFFFAAAFVAIVSLSVIIYMNIEPSHKFMEKGVGVYKPHHAKVKNTVPTQRVDPVVRDIKSPQEIMGELIDEKLPVARAQMHIPDLKAVQGKWVMRSGENGIATLAIYDDHYTMIYTNDPQRRQRKFSKGTFSYKESSGQLTLYPSRNESPNPIKDVTYTDMTPRIFDIFVIQKEGEGALYFIPPAYAIAARAIHPLFLYVGYDDAPVLKFSPTKAKKTKTDDKGSD